MTRPPTTAANAWPASRGAFNQHPVRMTPAGTKNIAQIHGAIVVLAVVARTAESAYGGAPRGGAGPWDLSAHAAHHVHGLFHPFHRDHRSAPDRGFVRLFSARSHVKSRAVAQLLRRSWPRGIWADSPASPTSPNTESFDGNALFLKTDAIDRIAKSAAGSIILTPPTALTNILIEADDAGMAVQHPAAWPTASAPGSRR